MTHPKHSALAGLLALPCLAWAHAPLLTSEPAAGAELAAPPPAIVLAFDEAVEPAFSSIKLLDGQGKPVRIGKTAPDPADRKRLRAPLPKLASGAYTVRYTTLGRDGHKRSGHYAFRVK